MQGLIGVSTHEMPEVRGHVSHLDQDLVRLTKAALRDRQLREEQEDIEVFWRP